MEQLAEFPIVGIGASEGGLEALEHLFQALPSDTGAAYVVVTHLGRHQVSSLPGIISRFTAMSVQSASLGARIEPNHVFIAAPGQIVTIADDHIAVEQRISDSLHTPIDVFMNSLALARKEMAIGILLSDGGSDGTIGMKAIKERGGLTIAQGSDGSTPQHSGMLNSAIASGVVDLVLSVEEIGPKLDVLVRQPRQQMQDTDSAGVHEQLARESIAKLLLDQIDHDFSGYKERTFMRRVRRRVQMTGAPGLNDYVERLKDDAEEVRTLFKDLLIGVTDFFRDATAFDSLQQTVIPKLFEGKSAGDVLRVWVPGCATGEEAYSIAILLREYMDRLETPPRVQLFATDIDEQALSVARAGRYTALLTDSLSPPRLQRYFGSDGITYTVNKDVREMCAFSAHSVLRDPPFSQIDLISCRNLLIYFGPDFQRKVLPIFHFALKPDGYLFLGTSENVSQHSDLFASVDEKTRIFQRRDHVASSLHFPLQSRGKRHLAGSAPQNDHGSAADALRRSTETRILERFAPAHLVVNSDGDILHYSLRTRKYLEAASGKPSRQLMAMARRGLRPDLRAALHETAETRRPSHRQNVRIEVDDRIQLINLTVEPFGESASDPLSLVVFEDVGGPHLLGDDGTGAAGDEATTAERLEQELRETRERLQTIVEEYETAVEELKSANEELQSTNEALETSKEEVHSMNEENHSVNAALNAKLNEIDQVNSDLRNLFDSTKIAIVFLDQHLVIRAFTPAVTAIFNLISTDHGRPLTDIASKLEDGVDLSRDIRFVSETGTPVERRVRRQDGSAQYLMRILPYRDSKALIGGALVTFVDVTILSEAEERQRTLVEELNHRVRNMLTVVGVIAKKTLAQHSEPGEFAKVFFARIQSLARAYSLVSREQWGDVSLRELLAVETQACGVSSVQTRLSVEGPVIALRPSAALSLGMICHELLTNALKYGAFADEDGRVEMKWRVDEASHSLIMQWQEYHNAKIATPKTAGFGTELITRELKAALGGKAEFEYLETGARILLFIPLHDSRFSVAGWNR